MRPAWCGAHTTGSRDAIMSSDQRTPIQSYRSVYRIERRLFKFAQWRLPFPHGLSLRTLGYLGVLWMLLLLAAAIPVLSSLLALLPFVVHWLLIPAGGAYLLSTVEVDGRPPHHVAFSWLRWRMAPKHYAMGERNSGAYRPTALMPDGLSIRPDACCGSYRPGVIAGPAEVILRYQHDLNVDGTTATLTPTGTGVLYDNNRLKIAGGARLVIEPELAPCNP